MADLSRYVVIAADGRIDQEWINDKWVKFRIRPRAESWRITWEFWKIERSYHGAPAVYELKAKKS